MRGRKPTSYVPSSVPTEISIGLLDWLRREFQAISNVGVHQFDLPITTIAPPVAIEGSLKYADGVGWNPGGGKGVYVYNGTAWTKL